MKNVFRFFLPLLLSCINCCSADAQAPAGKDTATNVTDTAFALYIPNAFTPNGETVDYWGIKYISPPIDTFKVTVYDRWGNRIFESRNPDFHWYGTTDKQENCPMDTYVYKLMIKPRGLPKKEYKGHFSLIR